MNTKTLNIEFLKSLNACEEGIDFVKRANLEGFPLDLLDQVEGDHKGFVGWLREQLRSDVYYNNQGLMVRIVDYYSNVREYEYNAEGLITKEVTPWCVYKYEYNAEGLMTKRIYPTGNVCEYEYNEQGLRIRRIHRFGDVTQYEYNAEGLMTKRIYPTGNVNTWGYEFDNQGRLSSITGDKYLKIPEW